MKCIFCKMDSSGSKSVEHIIPESLGNKTHVLPKGIVCDKCNNYFASKIEKEVLELPYFKALRGRNEIANKKGNIPGIPGFITDHSKEELQINFVNGNIIEVCVESRKLFNDLKDGKHKQLYIPVVIEPPTSNVSISKFIGKIALEALAQRVMAVEGWEGEFINNEGLDQLRNYVRFGVGYKFWPYHQRRIYEENAFMRDGDPNSSVQYEILHEYDFLFTNNPPVKDNVHVIDNLYFVCAIMGIEYTINMTNAGLNQYISWLNQNENKSILMMQKEEFNNF